MTHRCKFYLKNKEINFDEFRGYLLTGGLKRVAPEMYASIFNQGSFDENNPSILKMTTDKDEQNLIVAHNLSERSLNFTDRLGGLAMPSLAITKKDAGFDGYGEITLIGEKSLAIPSGKNPITDADMYSPRYPDASYKVDSKYGEQYFNKVLNSFKKYFSISDIPSWKSPESYYTFEGNIESDGDGFLENDERVMVRFLDENNYDVPQKYDEIKQLIRGKYTKEFADYIADVLPNVADIKMRDGYTYTGKRRYRDYNLETVIKKMKSQMKEGESFNYGAGTLRAKTAKRFKNLKEIQNSRHRIVTKDSIQNKKDEMSKRLSDLAYDFKDVYKYSRFDADEFTNAVAEGVQRRNLRRGLEEWGFDVGDRDLTPVIEYVNELVSMPTEYFEAKPQRAVGINEFRIAIVPNDITDKSRNILKRNGVKIYEYNQNIKGDRKRVTELATSENNDVLFRTRDAETTDAQKEMRGAYTEDILSVIKPEHYKQDGNVVTAEITEAWELINQTIEEMEQVESNIDGIFLTPENTTKFLDTLRNTERVGREQGLTTKQLKPLRDLAKTIREARKENGAVILALYDDAVKHEQVHEKAYLGGNKITNSNVIKAMPEYAKFKKAIEKREGIKDAPFYKVWNEALSYLSTEDVTDFGLTEKEASTLLTEILAGFYEANKSLETFKSLDNEKLLELINLYEENKETRNRNQESVATNESVGQERQSGQESVADETRNNDESQPKGEDRRLPNESGVNFKPDGDIKTSQTPVSLREKGEIPVEDRTYVAVTNAGQLAFAQKKLDEGIDEAQKWFDSSVKDGQLNDGATTAVGLSLMSTYGAKGDMKALNEVADSLIPMITEAAQAVQAMSLVSMFNPLTAGAYAGKIAKQRTGKDITQRDHDRAVEIAKEMADVVRNGANTDAVMELLKEQNKTFESEIEALEKALKLANQGKMSYRVDFETAQKEIAKLQKKLEEQKANRRTPSAKVIKEIEAKKDDLFARLAKRFGNQALKMVSEESSILKMSSPTDSKLSESEYNDLVDWATLTLGKGFENGLTPDDFLKQINELTQNELSTNQISDIHADAIANLKGERKEIDLAQKELMKNRLEHYRMADNWGGRESRLAKKSAQKITQDASAQKIIEKILNSGSDAVTQATAILRTNKQPKYVMDYLTNSEKLSPVEAMKVLTKADELWQQVKADIKKESLQKNKDKSLNDADIVLLEKEQKLNNERKRRIAKESANFYDALSRKSWEIALRATVDFTRVNLLNHPYTHLTNVISNVAEQIADVPVNVIASSMDYVVGLKRGQRAVALNIKGIAEGFKALVKEDETLKNADVKTGIQKAWNVIKFGDTEDNMAKQQIRESNLSATKNSIPRKMIDAYINYSFRLLSAEDALFKAYAFRKAIEELAKVNSLNKQGTKEELTKNPTAVMVVQAIEFADEMTFQNENMVSRKINEAKNLLGRVKPASEFFVPFTHTPTNIVLQTMYNSPLGFAKAYLDFRKMVKPEAWEGTKSRNRFDAKYYEAVKADARKDDEFLKLSPKEQRAKVQRDLDKLFSQINQREFARAFGKATFGSGMMALGIYLASLGLMAGSIAPDDDDREETNLFFERRKAGIENRSVDLGLARFVLPQSPLLKTMTYGATLFDYIKLGDSQNVAVNTMEAMQEVGKDLAFEQPLLKTASEYFSWKSAAGQNVGNFLVPRFIPFGRMIDSIGEVTDETARKRSGYYKVDYKKRDFWDVQWTGFRNSTASKFPYLRTYADESTTSVSKEERGNATRRLLRTIDPFNTRSSVPQPAYKSKPKKKK